MKDIYITAFLKSVRESIAHYEPVRVREYMDFRIHRWLWELRKEGKDIPMPDGINAAQRKLEAKYYNSRRKVGSYLRWEWRGQMYAGVVCKQCGHNDLIVQPVIQLTPYMFRSSQRYAFKELGDVKCMFITPRHYKSKGNLYKWVEANTKRITPILTGDSCYKILEKC